MKINIFGVILSIFLLRSCLNSCFKLFSHETDNQRLDIIFYKFYSSCEFYIWDLEVDEISGFYSSLQPNSEIQNRYNKRKYKLLNRIQKLFLDWINEVYSNIITNIIHKLINKLSKKIKDKIYDRYNIDHQIYKLFIHDCFLKASNTLTSHILYEMKYMTNNNNKYYGLENFDEIDLERAFKIGNDLLLSNRCNRMGKMNKKKSIKVFPENTNTILNKLENDLTYNIKGYFKSIILSKRIKKLISEKKYGYFYYKFALERYRRWFEINNLALQHFGLGNNTINADCMNEHSTDYEMVPISHKFKNTYLEDENSRNIWILKNSYNIICNCIHETIKKMDKYSTKKNLRYQVYSLNFDLNQSNSLDEVLKKKYLSVSDIYVKNICNTISRILNITCKYNDKGNVFLNSKQQFFKLLFKKFIIFFPN